MRCARPCSPSGAPTPAASTAVSCCGANPGMVSWFVKQALVNLAADLGDTAPEPASREQWGQLAQRLGVKGIHIAERDTQRAREPKPRDVFVNTWSVEGFLSEGMQPAELGWGTHETLGAAERRLPQGRLRRGDLSVAARRQHPRPLVDADRESAVRLPRHPQRVDLDRRLFHAAQRQGRGDLSPDLPLRLSPLRRRGAVPARIVRPAPARSSRQPHI